MYWTKDIPPKFQKTYCSMCGNEFGPGDHGFSMCEEHQPGYAEATELRECLIDYAEHWDLDNWVMSDLARLITRNFKLEKKA